MRALIDFPYIDFPYDSPYRARSETKSPIESVRERASFDHPIAVLRADQLSDIAPLLEKIQDYAREGYWCVGYVAYEAAAAFDPAYQTHQANLSNQPYAYFGVFATAQNYPENDDREIADFFVSPWQMGISETEFTQHANALHDRFGEGACYQVNFTAPAHSQFSGDAESFFTALKPAQPQAYCAYLNCGDHHIASVSPELFFDWNSRNGHIVTQPMKGTAPRYADELLDTQSRENLRNSAKERAENLMIVDLLRNDLSRIAGEVSVSDAFAIQGLPTVWQMTSTVHAKTRDRVGLGDIFAALFPCGSITGAPKIKAIELIHQYEQSPRGVYCGAIGVVRPDRSSTKAIRATFSVAIRTVTIQGNNARCGVGSGLTWDANPQDEWQEWRYKTRFLARAHQPFSVLETVRYENGKIDLWQAHWARWRDSAAHFGYPWPDQSEDQIVKMIVDAVAKSPQKNAPAMVRILLNVKGRVSIEVKPLPAKLCCPKFTLARCAIDASDEFLHYKTTARAVYQQHHRLDAPHFDTLLFNQAGALTEFTKGNLVIELAGKLLTPPLSSGLLAGTFRAAVLASGNVHEQELTQNDLTRADKIWFINSVRGWVLMEWDRG